MDSSPAAQIPVATFRRRLIPRIVSSLDDCGHLFAAFRRCLSEEGRAGVVTIHFGLRRFPSAEVARSVALFIRLVGGKLAGRIEGGYQTEEGEFFLLLAPPPDYGEEVFRADLEIVRRELLRHVALPHHSRRLAPAGGPDPTVEGVFLNGRDGESVDNALFRAFHELFGLSGAPVSVGKSAERSEIEAIIAEELVIPVYQPIILLASGAVHGHEALTRLTRPGAIADAEELFAKALRYGLTRPLEMLCRKKALRRARALAMPGRIFLNITPQLLQGGDYRRGTTAALLDELKIERSRIVFELTERTVIDDYDLFHRVIAHYRSQGYAIAIDDLGSGYAGLEMLARLEPDYVKLSRVLIAGIDTSATKQALVEALARFCDRFGTMVVAEGIERREELAFLVSAGVPLGQGYLLAKPSPVPFSGKDSLHGIFPAATRP